MFTTGGRCRKDFQPGGTSGLYGLLLVGVRDHETFFGQILENMARVMICYPQRENGIPGKRDTIQSSKKAVSLFFPNYRE